MGLPLIIAGAMAVGAAAGFLSKNKQISAEKDRLNAMARQARKNATLAKSGFYGQGNRFGLNAELETGRLARSHAQRIGSMRASIGGSGAVADSGTTWDVIVAQDAENQSEMNAFRTQVDSRIQDFFDQGELQYKSYIDQAKAYENGAFQLERGRNESMLYAAMSGGSSGASTGAGLYSAGINPSYPSSGGGGYQNPGNPHR